MFFYNIFIVKETNENSLDLTKKPYKSELKDANALFKTYMKKIKAVEKEDKEKEEKDREKESKGSN